MSTKPDSLHCPDCGTRLSSEAWGENLCMVCLLRLAAPTLSDTAVTRAPLRVVTDPDADTALGQGAEPTAPPTAAVEPARSARPTRPAEPTRPVEPGAPEAAVEAASRRGFVFTRGAVLADRYRVLKRLGQGGMGEVWRAYDLKLRVDVALKSLNVGLTGARGIELLRGEVRAAREVISPNVCRIFDLIEIDEHELVSMEYIDGHTLLAILEERGPLEIREAAEITSQFLAGLESIHQAGLVHRDIKPENLMVTRAGRVVVMDFGLTAPAGEGLHAGTPAYMAPEQRRAEGTDARADVFSAGLVLAEMLAATAGDEDSRQAVWRGARQDPPTLPESPWRRILLTAVAPERDDRYASAAEVARVLDEIAIRVDGAEDKTPYPGLAAFTSEASEFFFGREAEVEALWKKLQQAHLLGLIGPSGAGKSSFVQAGLLPAKPEGWSHIQIKPGRAPLAALGRALLPELKDDPDALENLVALDDPDAAVRALRTWRARHREVLLIVDQFEELFTQNDPGAQRAFAALLARAAIDEDVHVLLSMRDDFLMRCNDFPALAPLFSELTPLKPPFGSALRRALVRPALSCGYRFEDESMVEEMLAEVTKERAALPLLAFTASKLWEERDRETGFLTREVYDRLGGVGGALAQHAEATLEAVGTERTGIVRELFRNLVTADGTRAVAEVDEILSVFDGDAAQADAAEILQTLIDARLLTSYELPGKEGNSPQRRVEVVHESLLSAWPRLVRWQSQDADSLQLRDELRQAAKLWDARGRSGDLLWSGTAYREFLIWRERYPGRLTALEEAFATSMVDCAERSRRRRRVALTAVMAALLVIVAGVTTLWRRAETDRKRAVAQRMVAQATQSHLDSYPGAALAWVIKSLEIADTEEARLLGVEALWKGPPAWQANDDRTLVTEFNAAGDTILQTIYRHVTDGQVQLVRSDGETLRIESPHGSPRSVGGAWQDSDPDVFLTVDPFLEGGFEWGLWSAQQQGNLRLGLTEPDDRLERTYWNAALDGVVLLRPGWVVGVNRLDGSATRVLGRVEHEGLAELARDGSWIATLNGARLEAFDIEEAGLAEGRFVGEHPGATVLTLDAAQRRIATRDDSGLLRIWDATASGAEPLSISTPAGAAAWPLFSRDGTLLVYESVAPGDQDPHLWAVALAVSPPVVRRLGPSGRLAFLDPTRSQVLGERGGTLQWYRLGAPEGTAPIPLLNGVTAEISYPSFSPDGRWVAGPNNGLNLWSLEQPYPMVLPFGGSGFRFDPLGTSFYAFSAAAGDADEIFRWPLAGPVPAPRRGLGGDRRGRYLRLDPDGTLIANGGRYLEGGAPHLVSTEDGTRAPLPGGFLDQSVGIQFSPDGRLVAAVGGQFVQEESIIKVWDVESRELIVEHKPERYLQHNSIAFAGNRRVLWGSDDGLRVWDLDADTHTQVTSVALARFEVSANGRRILGIVGREDKYEIIFHDLDEGTTLRLPAFGNSFNAVAINAAGTAIAGVDGLGVLRVGAPTEAEPHLLFSHPGRANSVAFDSSGRWVGVSSDEEIRLWPMPDLSAPPLHTLPYDELLAKLRSLTNLRLVEDAESIDGWRLIHDPFPGWREKPRW